MSFDLSGYKTVAERIADFRAKHPEGSLQPADPTYPYRVETVGDRLFIVYVAAAYRSPDDPTPGIGVAWEPFPGRTPYTRDSELQNAETSAWGRAIMAVLASESQTIANAEDVRNRRADAEAPELLPPAGPPWPDGWESEQDWLDAWTELRAATDRIRDEDAKAAVKAGVKKAGITKLKLTPELAAEWRDLVDTATPAEEVA